MMTPDEVVKLPGEVLALLNAIKDARATDGDGGTKITRGERKHLAVLAGKLLLALTLDTLD